MLERGGAMAEALLERLGEITGSCEEPFILLTRRAAAAKVNPAAEALLGYSESEMRGNDLSLLFDAAGVSRLQASFEQLRNGGGPQRLTCYVRPKSGNRFRSTLTLSPVRDHAGKLVGASLAIRRSSHGTSSGANGARFSAMIDSPSGAARQRSTRAVFVAWNAAAEHLFGYADCEAIGSRVSILVPRDQQPRFRREMGRVLAGDQVENCSCLRLNKAGELVETSFSLTPIIAKGKRIVGLTAVRLAPDRAGAPERDGDNARRGVTHRPSATAAVEETVSQRRRALAKDEFRVANSNWTDSRWRKAFDKSSVPTAIVSTERHPLWVNKAYSRLTGYTLHQLSDLVTFDDITHPDDVAGDNELNRELLAGTRESFARDKRYLHADGHVVPVRLFVAGIHDESGALISFLGQAIDLTDQKRAEAQQEHTKHLTQFAFDQSPIATAIISTERSPVWVNDAYVRLLGYSRTRLLRLKRFSEVTHPEDVGPEDKLYTEVLAGTRESFELEKRYLHADGHVVPVRVFVTGIHDESGALVSLLALAIDLTTERKAQEERRHATRFAHVLFEQSAVAAGAIDLEGTIVTANDTLVGLSGYSRKQLIGSPFTNFVDPGDVDDLTRRFAEFYEGSHEVDDFEIRLLHRTGRSVPTRMYTSALRDDSEALVGFVGQILDLTEQKNAEAEREEQSLLRQLLLEQSPIAGGVLDRHGNLQIVNEANALLFGRSTDELIGKAFGDYVHPDDLRRVARGMSRYRKGTQDADDFELRLRHADGHYVPCMLYTRAIRDESGSLAGIIGQAIDLTEQKQAEEQREIEAHLRELLLDQSPIPVGTIDLQCRLLSVNDAFVQLFGYPREEAVGSDFASYIHPGDGRRPEDLPVRVPRGDQDDQQIRDPPAPRRRPFHPLRVVLLSNEGRLGFARRLHRAVRRPHGTEAGRGGTGEGSAPRTPALRAESHPYRDGRSQGPATARQ